MQDQDSATIVITFLFLLPWLGRAAVSAMEVWRAHKEIPNQAGREATFRVTSRPILRITWCEWE